MRLRFDVSWWRLTGSNRRPPACKAGALPAELNPRNFWWVWLGSNQRPPRYQHGALTSRATDPLGSVIRASMQALPAPQPNNYSSLLTDDKCGRLTSCAL